MNKIGKNVTLIMAKIHNSQVIGHIEVNQSGVTDSYVKSQRSSVLRDSQVVHSEIRSKVIRITNTKIRDCILLGVQRSWQSIYETSTVKDCYTRHTELLNADITSVHLDYCIIQNARLSNLNVSELYLFRDVP